MRFIVKKSFFITCVFVLVFSTNNAFANSQYPTFQHWALYGNTFPDYSDYADETHLYSGTTPFLTFDYNANTAEVMTVVSGQWTELGGQPAALGGSSFSVANNPASTTNSPDVAYGCYNSIIPSCAIDVSQFNGSQWAQIGGDISKAAVLYPHSLVVSNSGVPYVLYLDSHGIRVSTFNGTAWTHVGSIIPAHAGAYYHIKLVVSANNTLFAALDDNNSAVVTVWEFINNAWKKIGSTLNNLSGTGNFGFAISPNNTPYVAITSADLMNQKPIVVKLASDGKWKTVGQFAKQKQPSAIMNEHLLISSSGTPYLLFSALQYSSGHTLLSNVMAFNKTKNTWIQVGNSISHTISYLGSSTISLALDTNNNPYVFYDNVDGIVTVKTLQ